MHKATHEKGRHYDKQKTTITHNNNKQHTDNNHIEQLKTKI